jgi:hypothetical protein
MSIVEVNPSKLNSPLFGIEEPSELMAQQPFDEI